MEKRVAIVTGASRGIGRATAIRLAQDGLAVVVNYSRSRREAEEVREKITNAGGLALAVEADVSKKSDVSLMFALVERTFGSIDVLVNNAGISAVRPLADVDEETLTRLIDTNLRGTLYGLQEAAARMRAGGRIVNLSSTAVAAATPGLGPYIATKAGVEAMTRVFAKELRGRQITVNAIAPGLIESEMFFEGKTEEQIRQSRAISPLERLGEPQDVANMVAFLCSPAAAWVNGQVLRVNGGIA